MWTHQTRQKILLAVPALLALAVPACKPQDQAPKDGQPAPLTLAFITNNASDFWKIAQAGVDKAEAEFNVECEVKIPANGTPGEQKTIVEDLMARGVAGISISVIDPKTQISLINQAAKQMKVITQDSDAADSDRACFVGTNNYNAGVQAGQALKEAIPDGGKVWLFVGKADAQNAVDRKKGLIDAVKDAKIEIVDTRTDDVDRSRAKTNVEDIIAANDDIAALVGLWAYNGPAILEAVKAADKIGQIKIVAFDEEDATLQGVKDGHIHATVVQQPYKFGYESVRVLKNLIQGDGSAVPENKILDIPTRIIKQPDVDEFWANLKTLTGKS
jgi:ribose transport system substrate-binding protein